MIPTYLTFESALYDPSTISRKLRDGVEHAARAADGHDGTYDGPCPWVPVQGDTEGWEQRQECWLQTRVQFVAAQADVAEKVCHSVTRSIANAEKA
ncbi:hypothetical protein [Methylobacterium indicum]|uniref:Uncharacterized protein n=1 Tax=Methylobacterium indicum TaxID=1775910 RepID=A0A8H8X0R1_9HYPH|nr:hypothetical protein [Methylobacterium indicum]BCM87703.1 hypothetical protein mvi_61640 [Methylobacterium indicum]